MKIIKNVKCGVSNNRGYGVILPALNKLPVAKLNNGKLSTAIQLTRDEIDSWKYSAYSFASRSGKKFSTKKQPDGTYLLWRVK